MVICLDNCAKMLGFVRYKSGILATMSILIVACVRGDTNTTTLSIRMPDASPSKDNAYLCTSVKVSSQDQYVVRFEPKADKNVAHHMLLFGCDKPGSWKSIWDCSQGLECANTENILFAWANGASAKDLPKDVGFKIGQSSGIRYLVLQVHYKHKAKDLQTDDSGFVLHVTPQRQPYLAGIYLLWSGDVDIPPEANGIHSDIICQYQENTPIYAFAFRTHAHGLGRVISGYKVDHNNWTLLGKRDPKDPQAFYPMDNIYKISKGNTLAARCTYDSKGHHLNNHVSIGPTGDDEMCNFYIMYYRDANQQHLSSPSCNDGLAHHTSLDFPADSDTPLKTPTQKMTTNAQKNLHKATTDTQMMTTDTQKHMHKATTDTEMIGTDTHKVNTPTKKMVATHEKTYTHEDPSTQTSVDNSRRHKSRKRPFPPPLSKHEDIPKSKDKYEIVKSWPNLGKEKLGQVSGVAVDSKGNVLVFHRGQRRWNLNSFDDQNIFIGDSPIQEYTVLTLDPSTGTILGRWGRNMFYLPHGITVDHHDNIWLTDVGTHQVYKFPSHGGRKALLTVGEKFVPDSDESHLCKPTDVAVERTGSFFVADGYCNSRVIKFSAEGKFLDEWGKYGTRKGEFNLPHSLSLDESKHRLYIADRENGRVQVLHTTRGIFLPVIQKEQFGFVFAVDFNAHTGHLHVINGNTRLNTKQKPMKGFTLRGNQLLETWPTEKQLFRNPHDVISTADDVNLYVVEIGPNNIWKLTKRTTINEDKDSKFSAICSLDKAIGPCRAAISRWYFNTDKQTCKHFIYGGCRGNQNNFKSKRECEAKCAQNSQGNSSDAGRAKEGRKELDSGNESTNGSKPTEKVTDDWQNASGEDEGIESNIYAARHHNNSANHTRPIEKDQSNDSDEAMGGMIPALIILSVLAVPIVFLLLISIALRIRAYRRDTRYKTNRLLKTDKEGLAVGRTRGWWSYLNCCARQSYGFDKVNLAEFYSDSDSEGV